ncbi:hypothetical protein [Sporolactobacillus nakayamae]|uniref:Uncharacterized protein n=1 Tax=Sporolactobacillus nakayamae TaxID=269670 RepID=A0A1I2VPJ0_9BACL|nr:hypothetical protein [Sporolactobacillus nakayamae]SFG90329.1 hypothetical protein SAMN02982927_03159 [Sporolactobacillus nakayamae]
MDACRHYNGYQSSAEICVHRSSEWAVKKVRCPVCHAEIEVIVRENTTVREPPSSK